MNVCEVNLEYSKNDKVENHNSWMRQVRAEFQLLLKQQELDFSPCSSRRNSRRIWLNELCNAPLLERQKGFNDVEIEKTV